MTVRLFGVSFTPGSAADILDVAQAQPATRPRLIVTTNLDHIVTLDENAAFREAYEGAVARTLDGMPLVWLSRLNGVRTAQRVTGHDLVAAALAPPWPVGRRVYLVCATEAVRHHLTERIVGAGLNRGDVAATVPPYGFEEDEAYGRRLSEAVRAHGTTLLVMGVGAPRSEVWVTRQDTALGAPVVLAVGEALNVAAGLVPRAPVLMQRAGLEWFFRFVHAPRRLFRRYFMRSWQLLGIGYRGFRNGRRASAPSGATVRRHPDSA